MNKLTLDEFDRLLHKYENHSATKSDIDKLEPYRAKRAVLLASGFGSRMAPITINTPKPLVNVNGKTIISTILDALLAIDITEIYIVTGYKAECFELLAKHYPMVTLIHNDRYDTTNNISSAYAARHLFENAYVFESDLLIRNPKILKPYHYTSSYCGVKVTETPDWCFDVSDGKITDLHKGGTNCHHMYGISYWTEEDGNRLSTDLEECYRDPDNQQRFWDDIPCILRKSHYDVHINECTFDDVSEIDSFNELQAIDSRYISPRS